jgi:hypothetical protein
MPEDLATADPTLNGSPAGDEPTFVEIGATGLKRSGGRIDEEFLTELQGERGIRAYQEMRDNDDIVGAVLFALEMIIRDVDWSTIPGGTSPADAESADFLASIMDDQSTSWTEFIAELVAGMLTFGWSWHEIVWKTRNGPDPKPIQVTNPRTGEVEERMPAKSKFDDGRIGVRKLPVRAQESLENWIFDEEGGVHAMQQRPAPTFDLRTIPIRKSLLFRTSAAKGNPEGRSALRNAYRSWYFKRSIQEIEAIGIERDLAGFPVAGVPARFFKANATAEEKAALGEWERTMRDIRMDSLQGLVKPNDYDEHGNNAYTVELLTSAGERSIDTGAVIQRYNVGIASTVLADFILLGHEKVGSFALASQKSDLFSTAVNGWLKAITEVLNRHLVPKLFEWNDFGNMEKLPEFQPSTLGRVDLAELGTYIKDIAGVGYDLFPNQALESALLQAAELPEPTDEEADEREAAEEEGSGIRAPAPPTPPPPGDAPPDEEIEASFHLDDWVAGD